MKKIILLTGIALTVSGLFASLALADSNCNPTVNGSAVVVDITPTIQAPTPAPAPAVLRCLARSKRHYLLL